MPKNPSGFYAVKKGRVPGIYSTWDECEEQVKGIYVPSLNPHHSLSNLVGNYRAISWCRTGFGGAVFKKFRTASEAQAFIGDVSNLSSTSNGASHRSTVNHHQGPSHNATSHQLRQAHTASRAIGGSGSNTNDGHMRQARTLSQVTPTRGDGVGADEREKTGSTTAHQGQYSERDTMTMIVYTDGACSNNGTKGAFAGIGVWWGHGDASVSLAGYMLNRIEDGIIPIVPAPSFRKSFPRGLLLLREPPKNISERCPGGQTNNRAELIAIVRMLEELPRPSGGERPHLVIRTDSKYSISCINLWIRNWELNGWKSKNNQEVKNAVGYQIKFEHVRGHSGEVGNENADYLARMGTLEPPLSERDWDEQAQQVEERIDKMLRDSNASPSKRGVPNVQVEMEDIPDDFFLSAEELEALEGTQEF
ncbi:ribonuclease H-like protein [Serendipita vermifera]|nr:ribonuclease H-like protein [Serendipita vermifera]